MCLVAFEKGQKAFKQLAVVLLSEMNAYVYTP